MQRARTNSRETEQIDEFLVSSATPVVIDPISLKDINQLRLETKWSDLVNLIKFKNSLLSVMMKGNREIMGQTSNSFADMSKKGPKRNAEN